jgi:hypothetical protein
MESITSSVMTIMTQLDEQIGERLISGGGDDCVLLTCLISDAL